MNPHNAETRVKAIKARCLEIQATLTEWRRAFYADGIGRPMADRATLEAEYAQLGLEKNIIESKARQAKHERQKQERATLLFQLIAVLRERDMTDVIAEAQRRAENEVTA